MIVKGDAWFGSVRAASSLAERGVEGILQVKQNSGLYPKDFVETALKDSPGGVHIVLRGRHPNGHNLIAIGYRYSSKKTLFFIMTEGAGSTIPGEPYQMKFTDKHGNVGKFLLNIFYYLIIGTNLLSFFIQRYDMLIGQK